MKSLVHALLATSITSLTVVTGYAQNRDTYVIARSSSQSPLGGNIVDFDINTPAEIGAKPLINDSSIIVFGLHDSTFRSCPASRSEYTEAVVRSTRDGNLSITSHTNQWHAPSYRTLVGLTSYGLDQAANHVFFGAALLGCVTCTSCQTCNYCQDTGRFSLFAADPTPTVTTGLSAYLGVAGDAQSSIAYQAVLSSGSLYDSRTLVVYGETTGGISSGTLFLMDADDSNAGGFNTVALIPGGLPVACSDCKWVPIANLATNGSMDAMLYSSFAVFSSSGQMADTEMIGRLPVGAQYTGIPQPLIWKGSIAGGTLEYFDGTNVAGRTFGGVTNNGSRFAFFASTSNFWDDEYGIWVYRTPDWNFPNEQPAYLASVKTGDTAPGLPNHLTTGGTYSEIVSGNSYLYTSAPIINNWFGGVIFGGRISYAPENDNQTKPNWGIWTLRPDPETAAWHPEAIVLGGMNVIDPRNPSSSLHLLIRDISTPIVFCSNDLGDLVFLATYENESSASQIGLFVRDNETGQIDLLLSAGDQVYLHLDGPCDDAVQTIGYEIGFIGGTAANDGRMMSLNSLGEFVFRAYALDSFGTHEFVGFIPLHSTSNAPLLQRELSSCPCCTSDFNSDGGVDGTDLEAFYITWEAGEPCADVNHDGSVEGADVDAFYTAWQAGSC